MASPTSSTPSLTPSRSPTPEPPIQPDHFYGNDNAVSVLSPSSDGKTWLDPADDPLAQRGIPVFKPTVEEFHNFEDYMNRVECWGMRSGIVKVIPPKEWTDSLPSVNPQLGNIKLKHPIEQHMFGRGGLFRQENIEKRRMMSMREWAELCSKEELRAPGVDDIGLHARATNGTTKVKTRRGRRRTRDPETAEPGMTPEVQVKEEHEDDEGITANVAHAEESIELKLPSTSSTEDTTDGITPVESTVNENDLHDQGEQCSSTPDPSRATSVLQSSANDTKEEETDEKPRSRGRGRLREAANAERAAKDVTFLESFDPHSDWLPHNTSPFDYTPEFCRELERRYWRNCGLGKPAWYGADLQGSLFTDQTTSWNVGHLKSALSRLLPASSQGLPGVNTPYLYFGMWRATFAWHVEDMDLFSINYIHFGAPKFWYAIPQVRAGALEQTMKGYFPKDTSQCPQFLRHKSFLASPTLLSQSACRPNTLVQQEGEFVITYPRGYHAGFNLGFNCAESVNFALESWLDLGRKAQVCKCVNFSVRIDVDQLLRDREVERAQAEEKPARSKVPRKRKSDATEGEPKPKKIKIKSIKNENSPADASSSTSKKVTLKLPPKPKEPETFPCCLCVSLSTEGLLCVQDPPLWRKEGESGAAGVQKEWMAHETCANVVPETWIDEIDIGDPAPDGTRAKEKVVFGVDGIVKDRWNLKCNACTKPRYKTHGAPIQCTKGRCPKAFHVSCAQDGAANGIIYNILREVEKEVVLLGPHTPPEPSDAMAVDSDIGQGSGDAITADGIGVAGPVPEVQPSEEFAPQVLKLIKKFEVEVLCPQHNPAIAEAKKAQKQDKIRNDLLALPPMTRIKLRVSAGVFEVSLIRVMEETKSVEVLWDRGLKREFKWGSVVFGNTEGVVGQKPAEAAPEPDRSAAPTPGPQLSRLPFPSNSNLSSSAGHGQPTSVPQPSDQGRSSVPPPPLPASAASSSTSYYSSYQYQQRSHYQSHTYNQYSSHGSWQYPYSGHQTSYSNQPYASQPHQYYPPPQPTYSSSSYPHYRGYDNGSEYGSTSTSANQYQYSGQRPLQWQQPYTGPREGSSAPIYATGTPASNNTIAPPQSYYGYPLGNPPAPPSHSQYQWGASNYPPPVNNTSTPAPQLPPAFQPPPMSHLAPPASQTPPPVQSTPIPPPASEPSVLPVSSS